MLLENPPVAPHVVVIVRPPDCPGGPREEQPFPGHLLLVVDLPELGVLLRGVPLAPHVVREVPRVVRPVGSYELGLPQPGLSPRPAVLSVGSLSALHGLRLNLVTAGRSLSQTSVERIMLSIIHRTTRTHLCWLLVVSLDSDCPSILAHSRKSLSSSSSPSSSSSALCWTVPYCSLL